MKKKNKIKTRVIWIILLLLIIGINFVPPKYSLENGVLKKGEIEYITTGYEWGIIEKGWIIGRIGITGLEQVYAVKGDRDKISLWYYPTVSEYGGYLFYKKDFKLPEFKEIEPTRVIIGYYSGVYRADNEIYAYSEDNEIINLYKDIVYDGKEYDFNYSESDLKLLDNVCVEMPWFAMFTDQVPGSAYTLPLIYEDDRCYLIDTISEKRYDITFVIYNILQNGEIVDRQ